MNKYEEIVTQLDTRKNILENSLKNLEIKTIIHKGEASECEKSRDIVNTVLMITSNQIKTYIEEVVTLALNTVFGDEYKFCIEYVLKRGKSEATLIVIKNGLKLSPGEETGGGIVDTVALGLRMALWSLREPRSVSTFVLDEPGTSVSESLRPKFGEMLKKLSQMLGIQMLIISHDSALIDVADKTFNVENDGKTSIVEGN